APEPAQPQHSPEPSQPQYVDPSPSGGHPAQATTPGFQPVAPPPAVEEHQPTQYIQPGAAQQPQYYDPTNSGGFPAQPPQPYYDPNQPPQPAPFPFEQQYPPGGPAQPPAPPGYPVPGTYPAGGDRVIAVDANPDRGTLSGKIPLETTATVRHLLRDAARITRYSDIRAYTSQGPSRLEVLASEQDPAVSEAFNEDDYRRTID